MLAGMHQHVGNPIRARIGIVFLNGFADGRDFHEVWPGPDYGENFSRHRLHLPKIRWVQSTARESRYQAQSG
jgi:hypothetical protein